MASSRSKSYSTADGVNRCQSTTAHFIAELNFQDSPSAQHMSKLRSPRAPLDAMPTVAAAYLETDAAYPEFKAGPLRFSRYCNGVILPHEGRVTKLTKEDPAQRLCAV